MQVTVFGCAGIAVVTGFLSSALTESLFAYVVEGARIPVFARGVVRGVEAFPAFCVTKIICTCVVISASFEDAADACCVDANIIEGAEVSVFARAFMGEVGACTRVGLTGVEGTDVVVVAGLLISARALAVYAGISQGTGAPIFAGFGNGFINTA